MALTLRPVLVVVRQSGSLPSKVSARARRRTRLRPPREQRVDAHRGGRFFWPLTSMAAIGGTPEVVARLREIAVDPKTVVLSNKVTAAPGAPSLPRRSSTQKVSRQHSSRNGRADTSGLYRGAGHVGNYTAEEISFRRRSSASSSQGVSAKSPSSATRLLRARIPRSLVRK